MFLFFIFFQILKLNPDKGDLDKLDPIRETILIYVYKEYNKDFSDLIEKKYKNMERINFIEVNCNYNPLFCSNVSKYIKIPAVTQYFADKPYNNLVHQVFNNGIDPVFGFIDFVCSEKSVLIDNYTKKLSNATIEGGTVFHLRAKSYDSPILKEYKVLSRSYYYIKCNFYYSVSPSFTEESLSIYRSNYCFSYFSNKALSNLANIVFENRFSHYHRYRTQEFIDLVDKKSGLVYLSLDNRLSRHHIDMLDNLSRLSCNKYEVGWAPRNETSLVYVFNADYAKDDVIITVNRNTDCLFVMDGTLPFSQIDYYFRNTLTYTDCWRYPEDSTKVVPKRHYKLFTIICSCLLTVLYYILIYAANVHFLPRRK